jgi:hypothetical protein
MTRAFKIGAILIVAAVAFLAWCSTPLPFPGRYQIAGTGYAMGRLDTATGQVCFVDQRDFTWRCTR